MVLKEFDTTYVYDEMVRQYIKNPDMKEYNKYVEFVEDPYSKFEIYVNGRKKAVINDELENVFFKEYIDANRKNLKALERRLAKLLSLLGDH